MHRTLGLILGAVLLGFLVGCSEGGSGGGVFSPSDTSATSSSQVLLQQEDQVGIVDRPTRFRAQIASAVSASYTFHFGDGTPSETVTTENGEAIVTHVFTRASGSTPYKVEVETAIAGGGVHRAELLFEVFEDEQHSCDFQDAGNRVESSFTGVQAVVHVFRGNQPLAFSSNKTLFLQVGDRITVSGRCSRGSPWHPINEYQWRTLENEQFHNGFDRPAGQDVVEKDVLITRHGFHRFVLRVNSQFNPVRSAEVEFFVSVPDPNNQNP